MSPPPPPGRTKLKRHCPRARAPTRSAVCSAAEAIDYLRECGARADPVHLVLLDLHLASGAPPEPLLLALHDVLLVANGFHVGDDLDAADSTALAPPKDFRFKPLVALVTSLAHQVVTQLPVREDGSVRSCDAVLPKPLNGEAVRVLLQGCCV